MEAKRWTHVEEVEGFLAAKGTGMVFKHSTRCPVSAAAFREFEEFLSATAGIPAYLVLVIEDRPVSRAVAEKLGVPHASPQAILVRDGAAAWTASHGAITREALRDAWEAGARPKG